MKPPPRQCDVHRTGGPDGYAQVSSTGLPALRTAPPAADGGPGDAWSPEHPLCATVQPCFLFTPRAIARLSKVKFVALDANAAGTVDRQNGVTRLTETVLHPTLTAPAATNLVSASLSTPIRLEADIEEASEPVPALSRGQRIGRRPGQRG